MSLSNKQTTKSADKILAGISFWLFIIAFIAIITLISFFAIKNNTMVIQTRNEKDIRQITDYACKEINDENSPIGSRKEITFTLDKTIETDVTLAFYTVHQYVSVWLDGENVYQLQPYENLKFSKTVGCNWVMIPIYREDAGKEVKIEITPVYESFRNREVELLIGSELSIYKERLSKDLPQLILGIIAVFVGIVFICVSGYRNSKRRAWDNIFELGIFATMLGFWKLTDTRFTPFILPDKSVMFFYISVTMLMIGIVPLMKWIGRYYTKKSKCALEVYCILSVLISLIQLMLQFLGILDIRETLTVTHIVIGIGVILAGILAVYEKIKNKEKREIFIGTKLSYLCVVGVIADVAAFYIKGNSSGLVFTLLSFLIYMVFVGVATMNNYSEKELLLAEKEHQLAEKDRELAEKNRELAEKDRELTERRIAVMMSQIRKHFIFNVLTTISGFCKYDAKKADEALIRFARYLRKNINTIEEEGMIAFSAELEQVEDYVALEQMRFPDRIMFSKNIEEMNFKIPPLTVQPLVENAIKHGLLEDDSSGTVMLRTQREENVVVITISDDGVGFIPRELESKECVGIRNVRYRLENMAGGSIDFDSTPGVGTKVTIKIPMEVTE